MKYLIVYLGGNPPSTPEEGKKHFEAYKEWMAKLGEAVVVPESPVKDTHTVNPDGSVTQGGNTGMRGYTVIQADSMEAALQLAQDCPFLKIEGTLEISELIEMPSNHNQNN